MPRRDGKEEFVIDPSAGIGGDVPSGDPDSGKPIKIGGVATVAPPPPVDEGDRVDASFDLQGRLRVVEERPSTSVTTEVPASLSSLTVLPANVFRLGATVFNDANRVMFLKLGPDAATDDFTVRVDENDYYEIPFRWTGEVSAIWSGGGLQGDARVTELTA